MDFAQKMGYIEQLPLGYVGDTPESNATYFSSQVEEHSSSESPKKSAQGMKTSTTGTILGKDIIEAIWDAIARTQLPSWVTDVPHNWGTAARGKLSANNWRVICTVHLPITLIRLWGGNEAPDDQKHKLQNFMDLVCAVQIANLRSISKNDIELYEHYIHRYLTGFKTLYKLAKVKPIHHMALHYGDILRGFGPTHTHGAAFYEWYIHSMQSQNHNMKLGLSLISHNILCAKNSHDLNQVS